MENLQATLFSFLRNELCVPINAIICYSEMIIDELRCRNIENAQILSDIEKIQICGNQILKFSNIIFDLAQNEQESTISENTIYVELVTPISTIIGYCEILKEDANAELIPDLDRIHRAAQQLLLLVDDIVNLTQKQQFSPTTVKLARDAIRALDELKTAPVIKANLLKLGKILIIDSNETNCDFLLRQLEIEGYTVTVAKNGQAALQILKAVPYDLILLDIIIPGMNGLDVLQTIKQHSEWRHIPVVVMSAFNQIESIIKCIELGAEDYLYKPLNTRLVQAIVNAHIQKKRLYEQEIVKKQEQVQTLVVSIDEVQKKRVVTSIAKTDHFRELQKRAIKSSETFPPTQNPTSTSKIISIHSYRGGTGKSNLTANLAVSFASTGLRVGIVDVDIQSPGIHTLFGLEDTIQWTLNDYLWERCGICEAAYDVSHKLEFQLNHLSNTSDIPGKLYLIPSSIKANDITRILREGYNEEMLIDGFNQLINNLQLDYLFIDTQPGINEETLRALTVCNLSIVLLRPDYQDYQGTAIIVELARILGVSQLQLVANKTLATLDLEEFQQQVESAYNVSVAGILPLCEEMIHLASSDIFCLHYPNHPLSKIIYSISQEIITSNRG